MVPGMANRGKDEKTSLALALLVQAGAMMEDESPALILGLPAKDGDAELKIRIARLRQVAADLAALASAACALMRPKDG